MVEREEFKHHAAGSEDKQIVKGNLLTCNRENCLIYTIMKRNDEGNTNGWPCLATPC
jgi:hypothetical protein